MAKPSEEESILSDVKKLTDADLERNLVTCDFRGRQFKKACLDELLLRARTPGVQYPQPGPL